MAHHFGAVALAAALTTCIIFRSSSAQDFRGLDGVWEGSLTYVEGPGWSKISNPTRWTKLAIQGNSAQAFYKNDNKVVEIKPGAFKIERLRTNAIIFAVDTGTDADGRWVQNWVYAITEKDSDTLIVNLFSMANNLNTPLSSPASKWTAAATGELKRAP
jgi:hypothetical protein